MTTSKSCAHDKSSARRRSTRRRQAAALLGCPSDSGVEPVGAELSGSVLGVDDSGFFLGLKNPVNVSVSCVSRFFLGAVVLVDGFGVDILPSSVTFPSVGPVF